MDTDSELTTLRMRAATIERTSSSELQQWQNEYSRLGGELNNTTDVARRNEIQKEMLGVQEQITGVGGQD